MKLTRTFLLMLTGMGSLTGLASGASYSTDFTGYTPGANLAGQSGWVINDTTPYASSVLGIGGVWGSRTGSLGYVSPVIQNTVYVSHPTSVPLVGSGYTTFSAMFQVIDSDAGYGAGAEARDTFGFRLQDGSGNNVFSFYLTPFDQDPDPILDTAYHTYSWSTGAGPKTDVLIGHSAQELFAYTVTISFATSGSDVTFTGNVNGDTFGGLLPGLAGVSVEQVGAIWTPLNGPSDPGSNQLLFDNISMVPETSSALLGLLGASLALVRRRRI